jgi:hypothetical protein
MAGNEPIEEHPQSGKMLFHGRGGEVALQVFQEGRDVEGLNVGELADAFLVAPFRESARGVQVRLAGVVVVDLGGQEFQHAPGCLRRRREQRGCICEAGERISSVVIGAASSLPDPAGSVFRRTTAAGQRIS